MLFQRFFTGLISTLALLLLAGPAQAAAPVTRFCVFDPLGEQGEFYAMVKDYEQAAQAWGGLLELHVYTDETVAVEDFKAGQCDIVNMTGLRARQFNAFTGTIDSPGSIETYAEMHDLLALMASPTLDKYMMSGQYEVAGIFPLGAGYPFVNDRHINTLAKVAGKKIAVMDWDTTQTVLVQQLGAQPVLSDITNYGAKFNNGAVDVIIAPIILYKPFELYRGLGTKGGIVRRPVIQLTMQLLTRRGKFPQGFGQRSREYVSSQQDRAFTLIHTLENQVDEHLWMYITTDERDSYYKLMREARVHLAAQGFYDKRMLDVLKHVRCKANPADAECSQSEE
jgi:hypothetical protein